MLELFKTLRIKSASNQTKPNQRDEKQEKKAHNYTIYYRQFKIQNQKNRKKKTEK